MAPGVDVQIASSKRQRPIWLGIVVLIMLWVGVAYKSGSDWRKAQRAADQINETFALVFEENALRAIGEIDKTLLYMRDSIEAHHSMDLPKSLATTRDLLSDITVQVAVLDAKGIMRATSAGPQPPPALDLSDRPHFRAHVDATTDKLFIGRPLIGRASGRLAVQLSRGFHTAPGQFGGVVVASLDPYYFASFMNKTAFGSRASISLIGEDGVIRSNSGAADGLALGTSVFGTPVGDLIKAGQNGSFELRDRAGYEDRVVTLRKIKDQPLWVTISVSHDEIYRDARRTLTIDTSSALVLSVLIALTIWRLQQIEEKRSEAQANYLRLAFRDPLTGLPNRHVFHTELEAVASRPAAATGLPSFAVLSLDLDRFKFVNDTLGHSAGDKLLIAIGERISSILQPDQVLARIGGDEFVILVRELRDPACVDRLAQAVCRSMAEPFTIDSHKLQCGISIGVALGPVDGKSADEILVAADLALYAAKAKSRGIYMYYRRSMSDGMLERRELEADLRAALEAGDIALHYQPCVSSKTSRIAGFEALARWNHPVRGPVPPSLFIPIAEECGLIHDLGEWALREACRQAMTWPAGIKIAVNLSPVQFAGPDLVEIVERALAETGLPASRLELEITEQTILDNGAQTMQILESLRDLGVSIAMDDFGTGYSSLNYLSNFFFDRIKVDRNFVAKLGKGEGQVAIVRAVIDIARSMQIEVTAEGVESAEQRDKLVDLGCGEIQGFFYSRAVPADKVADLLAHFHRDSRIAA